MDMPAAVLPAAWKKWVLDCLLKGVDAESIASTLFDNGFTYEAIAKSMGANLPKAFTGQRDSRFYHKLSQPKFVQRLEEFGAKVLDSELAQLYRLDGFLTTEECALVIEKSKTKLRPSTIAAKSGYEGFRTSTTCDLAFLDEPGIDAIDQKIIDCLGTFVGQNEVIQAQHYAVGQEFKAHTDYFEPGAQEYLDHAKTRGQRTWTFMVYLNQGCEGGATEFPLLGQTITPKTGTALIWNNIYPNGVVNSHTLHRSIPVQSGEKVVITKWFRDKNQ